MKRYFLLFLICLCFVSSNVVCAEETSETTESSDSGSLDSNGWDKSYFDDAGHSIVASCSIICGDIDYDLIFKPVIDGQFMYIEYYPKTDTTVAQFFLCTTGSSDSDVPGGMIGSGSWNFVNEDGSTGEAHNWGERDCGSRYNLYTPQNGDPDFLITNVPIFDATKDSYEESKNNYISSGDTSGAENASDIAREDSSVELPKNLKMTGGYATGIESAYSIDKDISLNWIQTVDTFDYSYSVEAQVTMEMQTNPVGASSGTGDYYSSDWILFSESDYSGAKQISLTLNHKDLDKRLIDSFFANYYSQKGEVVPYKGYTIASIKVRVRNISNSLASNYVVVTIDKQGTKNTASVEDENGDVVSNEDYDGQTSIVDDEDVELSDLTDISSVVQFIKNGFGLFGSNGLLAMFSNFFSFLPGKFWSLIMLGFSLMIFIGLINFLLKR